MNSEGIQTQLKQYIDIRIKEYVKYSQRFRETSEDAEQNSQQVSIIRSEIKNIVSILNEVINMPDDIRRQITSIKDFSDEDISSRKAQLGEILAQLEKIQQKQQSIQIIKSQRIHNSELVRSDTLKQLNDLEPLTRKQKREDSKYFASFLLVLEGVSYIFGLFSIIIFIYNMAIK